MAAAMLRAEDRILQRKAVAEVLSVPMMRDVVGTEKAKNPTTKKPKKKDELLDMWEKERFFGEQR